MAKTETDILFDTCFACEKKEQLNRHTLHCGMLIHCIVNITMTTMGTNIHMKNIHTNTCMNLLV